MADTLKSVLENSRPSQRRPGVALTECSGPQAWVSDQKRTGGPVLPLSLGSPERIGSVRSLRDLKPYMTQLVGIARDVDGGDTAVAALKGHRVNRTVFAAHHEAGQTVDSRVAHLNGGKARILARNAVEEAQNFLAA